MTTNTLTVVLIAVFTAVFAVALAATWHMSFIATLPVAAGIAAVITLSMRAAARR
jgi:hypothetical protein